MHIFQFSVMGKMVFFQLSVVGLFWGLTNWRNSSVLRYRGLEPRALHTICKYSTTELDLQFLLS